MHAPSWLRALAGVCGLAAATCAFAAEPADARAWHRLVGILQYLQSDYPEAVRTQNAAELEEQRSLMAEAQAALQELGAQGAPFKPALDSAAEQVVRGAAPEEVERALEALVNRLAVAGRLIRSPRAPPDLARGGALFQTHCTSCHGPEGRADGPAARALNPPPTSFHGGKIVRLTPYQVFNTLTFGIRGTGMAGYPTLPEDDRWALAFFVSALRQGACPPARLADRPQVGLEELSSRTDEQLAERYGPGSIACLRRELPAPESRDGLQLARAHVQRALTLGREGNLTAARQAIVDAYLEGVEPVEPRLRAKSAEEVLRLEAAFLRARAAAEHGPAEFERQGTALLAALDSAERLAAPGGAQTRFASVFWLALFVLMREGFEASIVVGALLAVLRKMGQESQARAVHVGWTSALVAGALSFIAGQRLLAGANREWMEAVVALIACGMLLYAALWLNARVHVSRYMGELRTRVQGTLDGGRTAGLFFIAFSAVFRECFETALFLQGLSIDSPAGALWGALAGLAALLAMVLVIRRVGYRLPMKPLFRASTWLLVATAIILLGKGLHALQEVGALPLRPVPFFTLEALGIFPDAISLGAQLLLIAGALVWGRRQPPSVARPTAEPSQPPA